MQFIDKDSICWPADVGYVFVKNDCNVTKGDARVAVDVSPLYIPPKPVNLCSTCNVPIVLRSKVERGTSTRRSSCQTTMGQGVTL
jgi:hypothetical protein